MNRTLPERVETPRLLLRQWHTDDASALKAVIDSSLPHLQQWLPWAMEHPQTLAAIEARVRVWRSQFEAGAEWLYAVCDRGDGRIVGGIGLHRRGAPDTLEIGYWLAAAETGRGFMTEATDALTRLALQQDGIIRVRIKCDPSNLPSAGVPRRVGYQHLGTFSEAVDAAPKMMWECTAADKARP